MTWPELVFAFPSYAKPDTVKKKHNDSDKYTKNVPPQLFSVTEQEHLSACKNKNFYNPKLTKTT